LLNHGLRSACLKGAQTQENTQPAHRGGCGEKPADGSSARKKKRCWKRGEGGEPGKDISGKKKKGKHTHGLGKSERNTDQMIKSERVPGSRSGDRLRGKIVQQSTTEVRKSPNFRRMIARL